MKHVADILDSGLKRNDKDLVIRATGKFYTHHLIAERLASSVVELLPNNLPDSLSVIDPFCGDGRLIIAFLKALRQKNAASTPQIHVFLWDMDARAVSTAEHNIISLLGTFGMKGRVEKTIGDAFRMGLQTTGNMMCVVTNPPWEGLKPDRRELKSLNSQQKDSYIKNLREYDLTLARDYPISQPSRKFAGWGTNLSRCGLELSLRLLDKGGICGIVLPLSATSDQASIGLRQWMIEKYSLVEITQYPAEARLFDRVDQNVTTLVLKNQAPQKNKTMQVTVVRVSSDVKVFDKVVVPVRLENMRELDYCLPLGEQGLLLKLMGKWRTFPTMNRLEEASNNPLCLGRELDETNYRRFLRSSGNILFVKGYMIDRYGYVEQPSEYVDPGIQSIPDTAKYYRIVWRDVSRRNQARRMKATIISPSFVTGNSLHIAYYKHTDLRRLRALLVLINSIPFEYQMRMRLGTGHISLGVIRKVHVPSLDAPLMVNLLNDALDEYYIKSNRMTEASLEVLAAILYGLTKSDYIAMLDEFIGLSTAYKRLLFLHPFWERSHIVMACHNMMLSNKANCKLQLLYPSIPNHYSATLSALDIRMAKAVPPGGNWKDIPKSIPSKRLEGIRKSFAEGLGSRSTYYGRLRADKPAYTINTYFSRPGNGCHLHYDYDGKQHRVISQREAARLQSFPDSFIFLGNKTDINTQIGNAVPPLLGYCIAKSIPFTGCFLDMFAGAGGIGLGFKWAGWSPIVANDIESDFLATYEFNVHPSTVCGDIRNKKIVSDIEGRVRSFRNKQSSLPFFVLGGPPCQGFSTGGMVRSMEDDRNMLFMNFKDILLQLKPDGFLFENVTGLLNMNHGEVFKIVKAQLGETAERVSHWILNAEQYAIPQRRTRVIITGSRTKEWTMTAPMRVTALESEKTLFESLRRAVSTIDALSDLPPICTGEDGSFFDYKSDPTTPYQELMRGLISADAYYAKLRSNINPI